MSSTDVPNGWALPCPVCGTPVPAGPAPCPTCGLPAAGQAATVVARIGATITELSRDRDALLATLRAGVSGPAPAPPAPAAPPPPAAAPPIRQPTAPSPFLPQPPPPPRRRLSPQQVLLGLGALLVVAAAITFVAVAWERLGVGFQAGVMLAVTSAICAASAWTARRDLRATEEALAAAGAALVAVDLGAAHALGLFDLENVSLRLWTAVSCLVLVVVGVALGRLTRTTVTWPLVALLAAQPVAFLLLPPDLLTGPATPALALALAAADLVAAARLRRPLVPVAQVLGLVAALTGVLTSWLVAASSDPGDSWLATGALALGAAAAIVLATRGRLPRPVELAAASGVVVGVAAVASLRTLEDPGPVVAAGAGVALLTAAVLLARVRLAWALLAGLGTTGSAGGALLLADDDRLTVLALVVLAAVVPAVLAALRLPALRSPAAGAALAAPGLAAVIAEQGEALPTVVAGLLLALLAAAGFGLAALRANRPEEPALAGVAGVVGLVAGALSTDVEAWGQVGLQLSIAGAAAAGYALAARRQLVAVVAVADLVMACWIAVGGAGVQTPEAYTLPAAAGLLLVALPRLRAGAPSWTAEGSAVVVTLVPSAFVVVAEPTALRLVLVVAAAAALTVVGTVAHRQAPFVVGAAALLFVVIGRLAPYAPLLPRWLTLGTAGLLLLVVGATYERRRQQAREAVAWVAQMR